MLHCNSAYCIQLFLLGGKQCLVQLFTRYQVCLRIQLTLPILFENSAHSTRNNMFHIFLVILIVLIIIIIIHSSFWQSLSILDMPVLSCKCYFVIINGFSRSLKKSFHDSVHYRGLWNIQYYHYYYYIHVRSALSVAVEAKCGRWEFDILKLHI